LEKKTKETLDKTIEIEKSNLASAKTMKERYEEKEKLKEKLAIAKEQIRKEREEFRSKFDKAYDDLMR
jgi:transposase